MTTSTAHGPPAFEAAAIDVAAIGFDPDAAEAFYREHLPAVRGFVARRIDNPHDAADLTADVFIAAIEAADRYRPNAGSPGAWLMGIARNVVSNHYRSSTRGAAALRRINTRALIVDESLDHLVERLDAERDARELWQRLADLPSRQRAVVELVAVDGLNLNEAAAALGISATNARVRYHRAKRTLTAALPDPFEVTP